eukprot:gene12318-16522_t
MNSPDGIFKHVYTLINPEEVKKEWYEEVEDQICSYCPAMTFQQRIIGCCSLMVVGFLISLGSTLRLIELIKGNPEPFAVMYTIGNILSMGSTCFLYGPWSQVKKMMASNRIFATAFYFFFMGLTLFLAFYPYYIPLRILFLVISIILQFVALVWYTLSYIPYGREMVKTCCRQTCCRGACPANQSSEDENGWF